MSQKLPLKEENHIARYCKPSQISQEGRVSGAAFRLREQEEYLSHACVEYHAGEDLQARLENLRVNFNRSTRANSKFAVHEIGDLVSYVKGKSNDNRILKVIDESHPGNPDHCGVHGLRYDDDVISDLIAECVKLLHPAKK